MLEKDLFQIIFHYQKYIIICLQKLGISDNVILIKFFLKFLFLSIYRF